ncbi:MAG: UDP-N-acetylmuramoyl-tripeptide--D-alanyl-D-alanine ligase, partial [Oscillospiraceae bacterium]|nr:UDP-N-acetylmuramoyl-tripeptide--D-alanyl-D-alanine ligase [Oscillospiraceae bacterium]
GYFAQSGTDRLIAVGDLARFMAEGARDAGLAQADYFPTLDEAKNALSREVRAGVTILVKASRSMAFEKVVDFLLASVPE